MYAELKYPPHQKPHLWAMGTSSRTEPFSPTSAGRWSLSFHATLISNAEPKEWFDSAVVLPRTKLGSKPPPKERIRSRRLAFSHSFHSPCSWAAPSRWEPYAGGYFGPNCRLLELRNWNIHYVVGASHLVAAAYVPGRKLVDLEMSLLVAAGLEIDASPMVTKCRPPLRVAGSAFTRYPSCNHLMQLEIVWTVPGFCRL